MKIFSINKSELAKNIISLTDSYCYNDSYTSMIRSLYGTEYKQPSDEDLVIEKFLDGEFCPIFKTSIRNDDIILICDGNSSEDIMKFLLTIDAAKRSGAKSISVIIPYLPYSRSDKNDHIRQSISAKLIADLLQSVGVHQVITVELHNGSIQGFYNVPVIHLSGNAIFIDEIKKLQLDNLCFVAPDHGATKRTLNMAKHFDSTFAVIDKKRIKPNEIASMSLINSVEGTNVFIVDDIGDTMRTICKASDLLIEQGAKSVRGILTHPVFSGPALDIISRSSLSELYVSDTIPSIYSKVEMYNQFENKNTKINIISSDYLISVALRKLMNHESINELNS